MWDLEDSSEISITVSASDSQLIVSPDGSWFASAGGDAVIRVSDPLDDVRCSILAGHETPPTGLAADPTGRYLCSVAADATIRVWTPSTGPGRRIVTC